MSGNAPMLDWTNVIGNAVEQRGEFTSPYGFDETVARLIAVSGQPDTEDGGNNIYVEFMGHFNDKFFRVYAWLDNPVFKIEGALGLDVRALTYRLSVAVATVWPTFADPVEAEPIIVPTKTAKNHESLFWAYHQSNPQIYSKLVEFARAAKLAGRTRLGIAMLFERLRWDTMIGALGETTKLCNTYRAFYARLIMKNEPDLVDFFSTRVSQADSEI